MEFSALDVLRQCGLFRDLDLDLLFLLAGETQIRRFPKGHRIFNQGEECPGLFVVYQGRVRLFQIAPNGKTHVLHFADPGRTFAEVAAFGHFPCPAFAESVEDSVCAVIPTDRLLHLLRTNHALCLELLTSLSRWVRQLVGLLEDIVLRDASGRVAAYILRVAPDNNEPFALPILRKDLASHLNLTSETLSRTLRRLSDIHLIDITDAQLIRILDSAALKDVADGLLPAEFA